MAVVAGELESVVRIALVIVIGGMMGTLAARAAPPEKPSVQSVQIPPAGPSLTGDNSTILIHPEGGRLVRITPVQWPGNVLYYQLPEYIVPTVNRGKILPNAPSLDPGNGSLKLSGRAIEPFPAEYAFVLRAANDHVSIAATLKNVGTESWNAVAQCVLCLRLASAPDFFDSDMSRTYIHVAGRFLPIHQTKRKERLLAYLLDSNDLDLLETTLWIRRAYPSSPFRSEIVDCSLIVRSSKDDRRHVAVAWENAVLVAHNLNKALNCIHSDPRFAQLNPGESRTVNGRVYCFSGTREQLFEKFVCDVPSFGYRRSP